MKLLVSDMGGVLYSFDASLDLVKHGERFDEVMKKLGLTKAPLKKQLEGEWELVIVSTSGVKTSDWILKKIGVRVEPLMIFDMSDYGSKKDLDAWRQVFEQLPGVEAIVEDGKENLQAAGEAVRALGLAAALYTHMPKLI